MEATRTDGWVTIDIILWCAKEGAKDCLYVLEAGVAAPFGFGLTGVDGR